MSIVIVTHNMQQAQRVADKTAFFLADDNQPGYVVEFGDTEQIFNQPADARTNDYVNGHFG
jgi:phosphate transport system ATP-binding protein